MSAYLSLLSRAQALPKRILKDPEALGVLSDALGAILSLEGPPSFPLEGGFKWEVIRTLPKSGKIGQPRFAAATWTTGSWTCLLLMRPSVPMGRGTKITLKDGSTRTTPHDSASGTAMDHIQFAARHFGLKSSGRAVLMHNAGRFRTFIAWRPLQPWEPMDDRAPGDCDNYLKTIADAMSIKEYRVFRNDRDIGRMICTKFLHEGWDRPSDTLLPALLSQEIEAFQKKGLSLEEIHDQTGLSFKALSTYLPEAKRRIRKAGKKHKRQETPGQSEAIAEAIAKGIEMLLGDTTLRVPDVAVRVQVGSRPLREALTKLLLGKARKALVEDGATLKEAAALARMSSPGLKYALRNDAEAGAAIAARNADHMNALSGLSAAARRDRAPKVASSRSVSTLDPTERVHSGGRIKDTEKVAKVHKAPKVKLKAASKGLKKKVVKAKRKSTKTEG